MPSIQRREPCYNLALAVEGLFLELMHITDFYSSLVLFSARRTKKEPTKEETYHAAAG